MSYSDACDESPPIYKLNDDCLSCVFERLPDLRTELQASRVCKRFQTLIKNSWQRSRRYVSLEPDVWHLLLPEHEELKYFLHQMGPNLEAVVISTGCLSAFLKDLKEMNITHLPNVVAFDYVSDDIFCYPTDGNIETLTKLFPNLRKFRITQPVRGCHISKFKQLQELHLYDDQHKDYEIKQEYLEEICDSLQDLRVLDIRTYDLVSTLRLDVCMPKLDKLRVLKLNLATLKPVLPDVLQLPQLKKLNVLFDNDFNVSQIVNVDTHNYKIYETEEFYEILEKKSAQIVGIAIDAYYMPLEDGWDSDISIHNYRKLKKLAICSWENSPDSLARYALMPNLNMICCRNWLTLSDDILLTFIDKCTQLQHLDVSYCKRLTQQLPLEALAILKKRKQQPLTIYYSLCRFEDDIEKHAKFWREQSKFLRFSTEFPPNCERGLSCVDRGYEFEFE